MNTVFTIIISVLASVFIWQAMDRASKATKNDGALTAVYQAIAGGFVLLFIPFDELKIATNWKIWVMLILACLFYAINDRIMTTVYRNLEASQISVLKQLSSVFVILIGLFVFKEPFDLGNIIAAILIIGSNILILYQKKGKEKDGRRIGKYIALSVAANLAMSIALSIDIDISTHYNLAIYAALSLLIPSLIIIMADVKVTFKAMKEELVYGNRKAILIASIAQGVQIFTMLKAYQYGDVIFVAPLLALSVFVNAMYELIALKKKDGWEKKIIASIMIVIAVFLISKK